MRQHLDGTFSFLRTKPCGEVPRVDEGISIHPHGCHLLRRHEGRAGVVDCQALAHGSALDGDENVIWLGDHRPEILEILGLDETPRGSTTAQISDRENGDGS